LNYYPHHIGDYAKDTRHLSMIEDGAYRRLIDVYYSHELPLPKDEAAVCRLVCARGREEKAAVGTVLREFFKLTDEGWRHKRCDEEIAKAQCKARKASESAGMRWHSERNANASQAGMRTHSEGNAPNSQEPRTNSQKPKIQKANGSAFAPPDWIPKEAWQGFEAMRAKIRKPMTDRARKLIVGELEKLRSQGEDPVSVLEQSERNSWQDVFPLKTKSGAVPDYSAVIAGIKD
jgi:uncharacterized protein YdaU (DUF1376 family)